jgi:hypothetical protein
MATSDINQAAQKVEEWIAGYTGAGGKKAKEVRVRPSGDDAGTIKVWVDLGGGVDDAACDAWAAQCQKDAATAAGSFTLEVRAESLLPACAR